MAKIVGVKFKSASKVYYFSPLDGVEINENDGVIVETARGIEFGKVVLTPREVEDKEIVAPLKSIIRLATPSDEANVKRNEDKKDNALKVTNEKIQKHNLKMKLIDCEFTFDNTKVVFYFTAEGRIDFRELVKDLASAFRVRIELRQVGIRDEAKLLGGIAPCGRACCCSNHLPDFKKVSIKMAKIQGLSLNPQKISGLCGRLMCCLEFENDHYAETYKLMPKVGKEVETADGFGLVIANNMLKKLVKVKFVTNEGVFTIKEYKLEEIKSKKMQNGDLPEIDDEDEISDLTD